MKLAINQQMHSPFKKKPYFYRLIRVYIKRYIKDIKDIKSNPHFWQKDI